MLKRRRRVGWPLGLLLLALVIGACASSAQENVAAEELAVPDTVRLAPQDSSLVIYHSADGFGRAPYEHTLRVLRYTKKPYATFNLASRTPLPALGSYNSILVATERIDALSIADAQRLARYVADGGGLVVLFPGWHPLLAKVLGRPGIFEPDHLPDGAAESITLHGMLMPGAEGLTPPVSGFTSLDFSGDDAELEGDAVVLAAEAPGGRPLAWLHPYGEGRAVFWNTSLLSGKNFRGLIAQSIVAVQPRTVRPMANWAVVYLDDFPSPGSPLKLDPIATEFDQAAIEFYANRWYPDMRRLAERFGVAYTSALVFSYNGSTEPPYRFSEWLTGRLIKDGQVVHYAPWMSRRDAQFSEMGLHGYNHESLLVEKWGREEKMIRALKAARHRWEVEDLGPYPETYVPPMNLIDSVGVQALTKVFPSINTIASLYQGPFEEGQDREFGPEPWNEDLYALPRNTSGYIMTDVMRLSMLSLLHLVGGWGHFIHPDEVYPNEHRYETLRESGIEIPEDGFRWRGAPANDGLYYRFVEWLEFAETLYPWIRYVGAQDAMSFMKSYQAMQYGSVSEGDEIRVEASQVPLFFTVYSTREETLVEITGGEVVHEGATRLFTYYVVKSEHRTVRLRFENDARRS